MAGFIGIDTSNYTTSLAHFDSKTNKFSNYGKLLPVEQGSLGLRQSDAVFAHLKAIPALSQALAQTLPQDISSVCVSTRPRPCEGSYMPCFVAGQALAQAIAAVLNVPCYETSHQEGHLAAVLASENRLDLFEKRFLAWHLSGGTTELLLVKGENSGFSIEKIGGTNDISAGQLIDRTGQKMGLSFPSGKALDQLAKESASSDYFAPRVKDCTFSLSGVENKVQAMLERNLSHTDIARFTLKTIAHAVSKASVQAREKFGDLPLVFSGGVSSNSLLRDEMKNHNVIFAKPEFSTDNALGCAVLAARIHEEANS